MNYLLNPCSNRKQCCKSYKYNSQLYPLCFQYYFFGYRTETNNPANIDLRLDVNLLSKN